MADIERQNQLVQFGRRLLELLDGSRKNLALYPPDHPFVTETIKQTQHVLGDLFLASNEVTLSVVDDEIYINDQPFKRESLDYSKLCRHLEERDATHLSFDSQVTAEAIHALFIVLARSPQELREAGGTRAAVVAEGVDSIGVGRAVSVDPGASRHVGELGEDLKQRLEAAREDYRSAVDGLRTAFASVASEEHVDYRVIKATTEALIDSVVTNREAWSQLFNLKHHDEYTFHHSVNVATIAMLIGSHMGVLPDTLSALGEAALLHDLGKQKVPIDIIQKSGALSEEEWDQIRSHPERGAKILLNVRNVTPTGVMVAYEHHIRYDGKGYPRLRGGRDLHMFTHIVSVADLYDALTSDRGYRRALLPDMAMRIILRQSGTAVHPLVVKVFMNLVGLYPVGTFVKLKSGEVALVVENTRDLLRPNVRVLLDSEGRAVEPRERQLLAEPGLEPPIESSVDLSTLGFDLGGASG